VRGAAHVGVLSVLEEAGVEAQVVTGTSVGSIVGAAYASGMRSAEMLEMLGSLSFTDIARPSVRSRFSLLDTTPLADFVERTIGAKTFADLEIPFAAVAADVVTGDRVVMTEGELARAVLASSAIPGVFPPIQDGDALYVDGGTLDLVPVGVARDLGADYVIAVDLISERAEPREPKNVIDVLTASFELMQREVASDARTADVYIAPPVAGYRILDFSALDEMYEHGRDAALAHIEEISEDLRLKS
jgi:NTE family protein